ncbi:ewing's tumor-associated antigen 1 [Pholidichthys leucotaenia]
MSGVRERITELAVALNRSPLENSQAAKPRANRLRRSSRPSPVPVPEGESPRVRETEFKTPTRILRSRPAAILVLESPHNDSDVHQDIVWDCSSPSPHRLESSHASAATARPDYSTEPS